MLERRVAEEAAIVMEQAADSTTHDYAVEDVGGENDFTSQMIGQIKGRLNNLHTPGIRWKTTALTEATDGPAIPSIRFSSRRLGSEGKGAEESKFGADMVMVLDIDLPDYKITKGVLVQAKRLEHHGQLAPKEATRLCSQCNQMLKITAASFVFLYSTDGLTIVSGARIAASTRRDYHALAVYQPFYFFLDFLICWIGDPHITATDRDSLIKIRTAANARNAFLVQGTSPESSTKE